MTGRLREELERIGDRAPVAQVSPDTWGRARRARTRDRVLAGAAVVAVLALVGGLGGVLPSHDSTPVAGASGAGVPDHIWSVPERMTTTGSDGLPSSDEVVTDPAVGRAAAAWATEYGGLVAVIGAADGAYHLLNPPGYLGETAVMMASQDGSAPVALSPDGTHLAYGWSETPPASGGAPVKSGIRVADLESGDVRTIVLHGGQGVLPTTVVWSPDGRWLAWYGQVLSYWTSGMTRSDAELAGRIAPGSITSETVPLPRDANRSLAVTDDGTVDIVTSDRLLSWNGHRASRVPAAPGRLASTGSVAPDGRVLAVGVGSNGPVDNPSTDVVASLLERSTGTLTRRTTTAGHGQISRPLGWIDDDHLVTLVTPVNVEGSPHNLTQRLEVLSSDGSEVVGEVDRSIPDSISVATDLMTVDHPTVDRPEPDWPWSTDRIAWTIGLGVAGALALVLVGRMLSRRRTRPM